MARIFSKHKAGLVADWEQINPDDWNTAQKIANWSHGVITPGNLITIGGFTLGISGLIDIKKGQTNRGTVKLFLAGISDIFDGLGAELSGTKGPFGRILDPTMDKLGMAAVLPTLMIDKRKIVPPILGSMMAFQETEVGVGGLKVIADGNSEKIQPDWAGKSRILLERSAIGSWLVGQCFKEAQAEKTANHFHRLGTSLALGSLATGMISRHNYKKSLRS